LALELVFEELSSSSASSASAYRDKDIAGINRYAMMV
jgi:hypothetical protein